MASSSCTLVMAIQVMAIYLVVTSSADKPLGDRLRKFTNKSLLQTSVTMPEELPCPNAEEIYPCKCSLWDEYKMIIDCSNVTSEEELRTIFKKDFPFKNFYRFQMYDNPNVEELRAGDFGNASFIEVALHHINHLVKVEEEALEASYDTLKYLDLYFNTNMQFIPNISVFKNIEEFALSSKDLTEYPKVTSATLRTLLLIDIPFKTIPVDAFEDLPSIENIDFKCCSISHISPGAFANVNHLRELFLNGNNLSSIPSADEIHFNGCSKNNPCRMLLTSNSITDLKKGSFPGFIGDIYMGHNLLTELLEEVWRPFLENGSELSFNGNPLQCACDIAWLITNQTLLDQIFDDPECTSGQLFSELDPAIYEEFC